MTEDEARHRWCPFVRVGAADMGHGYYSNRGTWAPSVEKLNVKCLGAQCMAWRWSLDPYQAEDCKLPSRGFCGLVGPEETPE